MLQYFASKGDLKDLEERLEEKMAQHKDSILTVLDQQTVILNRLDQERVFGTHRVDRLEERVGKTEEEIKDIKVNMATV